MKTTVWCVCLLPMFAAFSLVSCRDDDSIQTGRLSGKWLQVYDEGVVSEGYVYYTFIPNSEKDGRCVIDVYDIFAGDHTEERRFFLTDSGKLITIFKEQYGGDTDPRTYIIKRLTSNRLTWVLADNPDIVQNFEKKQ